ncbi:MAG: long-chain fatty acid--CoA ligase [Balneolaceae bacterium]
MKYKPTTILAVVEKGMERNKTGIFSATKRNGEWIETSITDFKQKVHDLALGLHELGVQKGDKVSIHSENSTEWVIADQAILSLGAAVVPIYTTQQGSQIQFILENSDTKVHIVSNDELFAETKPLVKAIDNIKTIISMHGSKHAKLKDFKGVMEMGRKLSEKEPDLYKKLRSDVHPDDLATLIYTSGTTGVPKGVMLSHNNIAGNALAAGDIFPFNPDDFENPRALSYLPIAHMFERTATYIFADAGVPPYYIEKVEEIQDDFKVVKPIYLITVPRLLEKIVTGIKVKGQEMSGIKKMLYYWAVNMAENYDPENPPNQLKWKLADKLVYSKIRELFGGRLMGMNVGGAALSPNIARFMNGIGIYCGLGYGLTETSPVLTGPPIGELRIGSSGKALADVEIKIAEDGEILAKGPNIMLGYYKMPEKTKEDIDEDGWFHTGDIGHLDEDGWLFVTDRKKDLFKLSTGKYIAPQPIENALTNSGFIEQAVVVGNGKKFNAALIVPNWVNMKKRFESTNNKFPTEDITENEYVIRRIQKEVDKVNSGLSEWEKVKKFKLLEDQFTIDAGEVTPTLKIRRNVIYKKYTEAIDSIYEGEG